jgi:hypothetical protein
MKNDVASIMLEHFTPEKIYEYTGVNIDESILPKEQLKKQHSFIPSIDDEDFINEHGQFSLRPKLYDDNEMHLRSSVYCINGAI